MIGFFIMLIYLAVIGEYLGNSCRQIYSFISGESTSIKSHRESILKFAGSTREKNQYARTSVIPILLVIITLVIYITGGAFIFNFLEEWTLLDSWYFCFLSLVTIGFGGFTPGRMENISIIATSAYILIGMTLMSVCFNLIQSDIIVLLRNLSIWSERENELKILLANRTPSSWHHRNFGTCAEVSTLQESKGVLHCNNKLCNSLPRSFVKTSDETFHRLISTRKSFESTRYNSCVSSKTYSFEIPPLPDSVLNRSKTSERNSDRSLSSRTNIDDTFMWWILNLQFVNGIE